MKLPSILEKVMKDLDDARVPYSVERKRRHLAVRVGRKMAAILPLDGFGNESNRRANLNTRAQIRRAAAEWKASKA